MIEYDRLFSGSVREVQLWASRPASLAQNCKALRLAAVGAQLVSLTEEAGQRNHSHFHYPVIQMRLQPDRSSSSMTAPSATEPMRMEVDRDECCGAICLPN